MIIEASSLFRRHENVGYTICGDGSPVLLLHSSVSSKAQWRKLTDLLATRHRVIAIDLYGYGDTAFPAIPSAFTLDHEVELVDSALARALREAEPFHVVGHSYGGAVALRLARQAPQRVLSLALYEPTAFHVLPQDDPALHEVANVAAAISLYAVQSLEREATALFVDYWNGYGSFSRQAEQVQALFRSKLRKVILDFRALFHAPFSLDDYAELGMPVCLIAGRQSPASSRRVAELLASTLGCSELTWIDAGHMAPITHAALVNPIMERFIAHLDAYPAPWHPCWASASCERSEASIPRAMTEAAL
jgi:pimeloyl-ACP methyl ester carboxylesterase